MGKYKHIKKLIYSILICLVIIKILLINSSVINEIFNKTLYKIKTSSYSVISNLDEISDINSNEKTIYIGSVDCPYCIKNIDNVNMILKEKENVYQFRVDFEDEDNQKQLILIKNEYNFDTIPHILLIDGGVVKSYSSKDIANFNEKQTGG